MSGVPLFMQADLDVTALEHAAALPESSHAAAGAHALALSCESRWTTQDRRITARHTLARLQRDIRGEPAWLPVARGMLTASA